MRALVAAAVVLALLLALKVAWQVAAYRECRAFGHSTMYCLSP